MPYRNNSNAGRFVKEGKCEAVKLEGGRERIQEIREIKAIGIPVLGFSESFPRRLKNSPFLESSCSIELTISAYF